MVGSLRLVARRVEAFEKIGASKGLAIVVLELELFPDEISKITTTN